MLNLPNTITLSRIVLVIVFTAALSTDVTTSRLIALFAFVLAATTDWLDGFLARRLNQVTTFGKLIDPLADKILVASAFIFLTEEGICPFWVTALIICREFLVTGLRQIAQSKGVIMAADRSGKWKTGFQLAYCIACLLTMAFPSSACLLINGDFSNALHTGLLICAVLLTVWSGIHYCLSARSFLKE